MNSSTAKPVELIKLLIKLHPNNNARILDFYAGSGTTGHAVMEL
nr:DNA methyltransferase [Mycoplasmopsis bovis]